jgi:hypothetical protein
MSNVNVDVDADATERDETKAMSEWTEAEAGFQLSSVAMRCHKRMRDYPGFDFGWGTDETKIQPPGSQNANIGTSEPEKYRKQKTAILFSEVQV